MATTIVHCKHDKYDVYIGRPGPWGNPFRLSDYGNDREKALELYAKWLLERPELIERAKLELKNKVLGCWCSPKLCHGNILAEIIDGNEA